MHMQTKHPILCDRWKQTLQDVDVTIPVPKGTRGRDLDIVIKKKSLKVGLKGKEPIIDVSLVPLIKALPHPSNSVVWPLRSPFKD